MEEFGRLDMRRGDDWAVWTNFEDDVPHDPNMPPPDVIGDRRDLQIDGEASDAPRNWRVGHRRIVAG